MRYRISEAAMIAGTALFGLVPDARAAGPFDGMWNVDIACAQAADGAASYELKFTAQVANGALAGQFSSTQTTAVASVRGQISPTGDAVLVVDGRTGAPIYTVGRVSPGTPYHYTANTHFTATSGSGQRNELRPCTLSFTRM
ncbi:MAG: hypothetical protein JO001_25975 [Alphaproteobacteria bacterium]|nr:hypothetical protein [Alphaproteobacteria bacterium]